MLLEDMIHPLAVFSQVSVALITTQLAHNISQYTLLLHKFDIKFSVMFCTTGQTKFQGDPDNFKHL